MTHVIAIDNRKGSHTKGDELSIPVTVLECPPIHILALRFYSLAKIPTKEFTFKPSKEVGRKIRLSKTYAETKDLDILKPEEYSDVVAIVYTQPRLIKLKKKPELFELHIGGKTIKEKIEFLKQHIGKDIPVTTVFEEGTFTDIHGVTTGKGFQGPVKRFGIAIRHHKSEKTKRGPGSLGGWSGQGHVMYRVAHAGQMGYHQRVEYNKQVYKIGKDGKEVTPAGGFPHYGPIISDYLIIKGSVIGPQKRMLIITKPIRLKVNTPLPTITFISKESKQ
jgi:large subunit ribosomal protein L3